MRKRTFHSLCCTKTLLFSLVFSLCVGYSGNIMTYANGEAQSPQSIPDSPQRIVVFPLFSEEMLLEMVGPERIVYVGHEYFDNGEGYSPTMDLTKNIDGRYWDMSVDERIIAHNPDLIVLEEGFFCDYMEIWPQLYRARIPFLFLDTPETIEDIRDVLLALGAEVGESEKATQMVEDMDAGLAQITEIVSSIPEEERARVFHYVYYTDDYRGKDEDAYATWHRQNSFAMTARASGVIAEGPDTEAWIIGGPEERLLEANPNIITFEYVHYDTNGSISDVAGPNNDKNINNTINALLTNPALADVPAIKNRAIYPIRLCESQFIVQSAQELAQLAYPHLFPEKDK